MNASVPTHPDPSSTRICASSDLVNGGLGIRFDLENGAQGKLPAFAIRHGGKVSAFLNQCAHVPVELDWQPGVFFDDEGEFLVCATHGASYRPADGRCAGGPCRGRGLQPVPCFEADGSVFVAWTSPKFGT
jgi:nitrite reductase/ring-hydroxylating ferredoxin subunit